MTDAAGKGLRGLHHVAIKVCDFERTLRMYVEGLGLNVKLRWGQGDGRAAFLDAGNGSYLEVFAGAPAPAEDVLQGRKPTFPTVHFALRVEDVDAAQARALAAGFVQTMAPKDITVQGQPAPAAVRLAFVRGPDGEMVEFFRSADV